MLCMRGLGVHVGVETLKPRMCDLCAVAVLEPISATEGKTDLWDLMVKRKTDKTTLKGERAASGIT